MNEVKVQQWAVGYPLLSQTYTWKCLKNRPYGYTNDVSFKPRVSKGYVDDTFVITNQLNEGDLLHHINNKQPSIRFTMETESENKIAFLGTMVYRDTSGRLCTGIYRKPTHTDQYLAYNSHRPQSESWDNRRNIFSCLYVSFFYQFFYQVSAWLQSIISTGGGS